VSKTFDLKERMALMGIQPKKAFGQNFLVSQHVIEKIIGQVLNTKFSDLLEIGPGLGALTEPMLHAGLKPKLIELDRDLAQYWRTQNLEVIEGDALRIDWSSLDLHPESLLVSNLPYQISSSLVIDRCFGPPNLKFMILMFQKEVAERLMSPPGCGEYGILSVMAQLHFKMFRVAKAAPGDFFPPPKVASRVLGFERRPPVVSDNGAVIELGLKFLTFVKAAFAFRRKFLLKNLRSVVDKSRLDLLTPIFEECGLSMQARAEELSPEKFVELFEKIFPESLKLEREGASRKT
jgi:16S rRNA (adenine1518-N6/adenine1519-N6)-dimethyltransferase